MIELPRELFQRLQKNELKQLALLMSEGWFKKCVVFAISQMAITGASSESLQGANTFINTLENLTDETPVGGHFPAKELQTM